MKKLAFFVSICLCLTCGGCRQGAQPVPTVTPMATSTVSPIMPTGTMNPEATLPPSEPVLPEPFASQIQNGGEATLKVYDIKAKEIKEMPVEEYLCGVLAGEMQKDFPMESLKAQAVVARTFLLNFLKEKGGSVLYPGADISTDISESQAYDEAGISDTIRQAVEETKGEVLTYDTEFILAWFHSCSGGQTAEADEGLNYTKTETPYILSLPSDESDAPQEVLSWQAEFTKDELDAALEELLGEAIPFESIEMGEKGPSGRTLTLLFDGASVNTAELRTSLGPERFRSTLLTELSYEKEVLTVSGKGFGHGVGMSQWGAYTMADAGADYHEILQYYFPGTSSVKIWM